MSNWADIVDFATSTFPRTEESTSWGAPALKVKGKLFARLRVELEAHGAVALKCAPSDKEALVSGDNPAFFTIAHYESHNYLLVDLDRVETAELRELVTDAWLLAAPAKVREAWLTEQDLADPS